MAIQCMFTILDESFALIHFFLPRILTMISSHDVRLYHRLFTHVSSQNNAM